MLVLGTTSFPRSDDGSEAAGSFVADVAVALMEAGQRVRVVGPGTNQGVETNASGIEVYRYRAPQQPLSTLRFSHPAEARLLLRAYLDGLAATRAALADGEARHMLALWALPTGAWARKACREHGIDYSVWMLGSDVWSLGRIPGVRQWLGGVMRDAKHRFADGLQLAADAAHISHSPVSFLPSSRQIETFVADIAPPREGPPYRLLFLGRWHPNKGIDLLLAALAQLRDRDWAGIERVRILGGGPMEDAVRASAATLQAAGRPVEVGGFVTKPVAEAEILAADWVLIPSRVESIPVVFSDAMKLGRPVICSPVGDLPSLVGEGNVGLCAREASVAAWTEALQQATGKSSASYRSRLNAMSSRFDLGNIARRIIEVTQQ